MPPRGKVFGSKPPIPRIRIRIQDVSDGGRIDRTQSFTIFNQKLNKVIAVVETALEEAYGLTPSTDDEDEDEDVAPAAPRRTVVRRRKE